MREHPFIAALQGSHDGPYMTQIPVFHSTPAFFLHEVFKTVMSRARATPHVYWFFRFCMGWPQQAETAANLSDFLLVIRRGWTGHVSGATLVAPCMKDVDLCDHTRGDEKNCPVRKSLEFVMLTCYLVTTLACFMSPAAVVMLTLPTLETHDSSQQ